MNLYRQGDWLVVQVLVQENGVPVLPEKLPTGTIYTSDLVYKTAFHLVQEDSSAPWLFTGRVHLDENYPEGAYVVLFYAEIPGGDWYAREEFEILPSGNGSGQIISLYYFDRTPNQYLVNQRDSGRIMKGKGRFA